ncbi:TetR family transcriptional regulator [Nonomuraea polychroma]|uniref:TetR family transcriptional regulator n=1 Tax=Nonomuraea polychroma TaxID=46176 RepID=A0A438MAB2_9ACTN|nr:TetR family transcriptional regulator [Nonomuraea polychroma]RVX42662.1 TetR family transcriptional regulator [Nonomuraea polychroma]
MADTALTPARILEAAEEVLRRYGPGKATVVDVARALGVSHGSVYRHFASKAALRDAVTERWLKGVSDPLAEIAAEDGPAAERMHRWLTTLSTAKQTMARQEPELFATYVALTMEAREVVAAHVDALAGQLARIVADGVAQGTFTAPAGHVAIGRAVLDATSRFHNPAHAAEWSEPGLAESFEAVWALILSGLAVRP